ncbi:hypothetical protein KOW_00528 [Bacillus cereus VDM006]|nr:hypothetical protein KOW_00528 [Bacillus cereus VDM006]
MKELRSHQAFDSLDQLNEFTSKVLSQVEMNETDRNVFVMLSRYSVKVLGVCWLKVNTIAEALGVSYKTVQRSLARLVKKNIIKRVETMRAVSGGYGASITVMSPIGLSYREEAVEPCVGRVQDEPEQEETIPLKQRPKDIKERKPEMDVSYLEDSHVPAEFINAVSPYYDKAEEVYKLWNRVRIAWNRFAPDLLCPVEVAVSAFKQAMFNLKMNRIKGNFGGYMYGTLANMFAVNQRRIHHYKLINVFD